MKVYHQPSFLPAECDICWTIFKPDPEDVSYESGTFCKCPTCASDIKVDFQKTRGWKKIKDEEPTKGQSIVINLGRFQSEAEYLELVKDSDGTFGLALIPNGDLCMFEDWILCEDPCDPTVQVVRTNTLDID